MADLRIAVFGCGFWARFQIPAWQELPGVEVVALYNRTRGRADALAAEFGVPMVYDNAERLINEVKPDVIDIITDVGTHSHFVHMAAQHGTAVICQKPMATTLEQAEQMVAACHTAGVPLLIHENWRWQTPIRALKQQLESGAIGAVFRARLRMVSGFAVFTNQPFLGELEQFILTDMGSHILDVARFLFGEVERLYCQTARVHPRIKGEDVATLVLQMRGGATVTVELGYPENAIERDTFPEMTAFVEGSIGTLELDYGYWLRTTTPEGTYAKRHVPPHYTWADPAYDLVHSSIVPCHANLLAALRGEAPAETSGNDNLRTVQLVFGAYTSAASGQAITMVG